ncbi:MULTISPECIES: group II intron maturase-specific domain-containing protein [Candidatus Hamiltonella]|uniref:group II intron maturase-specific domain-containing protein n=2 Tax=Candidatus Williamhamiltonella defendens TaxID=138072 RepID=UPI0020C63417|nr:group II intron maturase-specific domain-containing protein [Candidatus Hamiltonella defensa]
MFRHATNTISTPLQKRMEKRQWVIHKVNLIRYADDFIITGASEALLKNEVKPVVETFLQARGLQLAPEKTTIKHITEGFNFPGQNIRKQGQRQTCLIKPSKENIAAFLSKTRRLIKQNIGIKQVNLIGLLNPLIQGWVNYHRHVCAKKVFSQVDHEIWKALWTWCCRRHPDKGKRWIKNRYFSRRSTRNWIFSAEKSIRWPDGNPVVICLRKASDTPIRRHIKIISQTNPYDPAWERQRQARKMLYTLTGRKK